jgi:adenylate kinase family enzyme
MIINLVGPPGGGKSAFASRYVLNHPFFTYCDISSYRAESNSEEEAWLSLERDVLQNNHVVLETCGLNHQLSDLFDRVRDREVLTIAFIGDVEALQRRVEERQNRREPPFNYRFSDELASIEWVMEHLDDSPKPLDIFIDSTGTSIDVIYDSITNAIIERRITMGNRGSNTLPTV